MKRRRPLASSFNSVTTSVVAFDGACVKFRRGKKGEGWVCETRPREANKFPKHPTKKKRS
jgi:hypothetical protein